MKVKTAVLLMLSATMLVVGVGGFLHLRDQVHTYDQRFADCMEVKKSYHWPNYYYPTPAYAAMMDDCDRQASQ